MNATKITYIAVLIALALFAVAYWLTNEAEQPYQYGLLKSDPPVPPLTYTWSHPKCPFTANFPGKPDEKIVEVEGEVAEIYATYESELYGFVIFCDVDRLIPGKPVDEQAFQNYARTSTDDSRLKNIKIEDIKNSPFRYLNHIKIQYSANTIHIGITAHYNSLVFNKRETVLTAMVVQLSSLRKPQNGVEFYESVKAK